MRRVSGVAAILTVLASVLLLAQSTGLSVLSAGPTGEIRQLQDANEIRIIFSDPMVALGRIPSNPTPPWIQITPAMKGLWRWSGTTTLIFTPDPAAPLPHATRYTVTIDTNAASVSGRRLPKPFAFSFTTPTVRLTTARWLRQGGRFDAPVALALRFNQRVRPADALAHVTAAFQPHEFEAPSFSAAERARLASSDPDGLKRFDAKVALARQTAARRDAVPLRVATDWDRKRFPPNDQQVVLETVAAPPPGAWMQLTMDVRMPSPDGPELPPTAQTTTVELPKMFFVMGPHCQARCDPSDYNPIVFTEQADAASFARALTATDITDAAQSRDVQKTSRVIEANRDTSIAHNVEDAGFERQPPARTWALRLDPAFVATDGQTLGYPWIGFVENWHEPAFTSFGDGHGVWETGSGAQLPFYSRNFLTVSELVEKLTVNDLMPRVRELEDADFRLMPAGAGRLRKLNVTPDQIQSHGLDLKSLLSPQGTGLFWAAMAQGDALPRTAVRERTRSTVVQVTNLGITVKDSPHSTLVFVTRLDNGQPVGDARVTIINTDNKQLWRGTTDRQGLTLSPALPLRKPNSPYRFSFIVTAEKDGDVAYVGSDWNEGIQSWDFGHSYQLWEATDVLRGSIFTDHGVYKPGEQVHIKAILRADTADGIRLLPAGTKVDVVLQDARSKELDRRTVTMNKWSSAEWNWDIPAEASLGNYMLQARVQGTAKPERTDVTEGEYDYEPEHLRRVDGSFLVAAFRKPEFRVDTTLTAEPALAGAPLHASVSAKYLFGGTMSRRPVTWSVTRAPDVNIPAAIYEKFPREAFRFGYYPSRNGANDGRVAGETAALDVNGGFTATVASERDVDYAVRYTFESDVEDISRQHIANRSSLTVHPAPWYIGLRQPTTFADAAAGTSLDVVVADPKGNAVTGIDVTVSLQRIQWNSVRRGEGSGFYTYDTERIEVPAGEWTIRTSDKPVTIKIPVPEGGFYQMRATARDAEGRRTRTDAWFYALGRGYTAWERFDHNRIKLEPERKTWKPGERARIMVQSPWETATALLTVEREGIRRAEQFALTSTQQTVEVPISEADIPNVYVSVMLIRGRTSNDPGADGNDPGKPAFRIGYTELAVEDTTKQLSVKVTADREEYRPANRAKIDVAVTDKAGRPAATEVTLWAVDYGVLSLTDYRPPDVVRAVYQHKSLQISTEDSRQRIISRRVLTPKGGAEGGGGGMEAGVRRDFRPTAFWLGSVETDASGRATRDVTLPESLTTYRIMAVAGDTASRFGAGDTEIKVSKPVTLIAAFPRFLTLGDRASFGAVVTNTTAAGGGATVTIRSLDPAILQFGTTASSTVQLGAGASDAVRFEAVARAVGSARVQMTVRLGSNTDAFEMAIPVNAPARLETSAAFGDTSDKSTERLMIPAGIVPTAGGLNVELASSALVGLGEGARYLSDYPHLCGEQKASAALALVLAADLGNAFSMGRIAPADYRKRATALLSDLPRYQCSDSGFGYWPGCLFGDLYLTSYILHVMHVADGLGIAPDPDVVTTALDFMEQKMKQPAPRQLQWLPAWSATMAYAAKVLTEHGRNQDSNITRLAGTLDQLPVFGLTYLADAMASSKTRHPRYDEVIRRLSNAIRVEGDRAHVEEVDTDELKWLWNSNVRSTALVLGGTVQRGDNPQFVPGLVRSLLLARRNGRWGNTQENAMALESLVAYYKKFEAEAPNLSATVTLGSRQVGSAAFRNRSAAPQNVRLAMPDLLREVAAGTEADLLLSRAGTGKLFYATRLQYIPSEPPPPSDQGMRVERRFEKFVENGESPAATTFSAGDLIRVTLTVTLPKERRYVAVTDALPGGVEAVDSWFRTTATDLAKEASTQPVDASFEARWRRGGFDRVEKYDDRVLMYATRLSEGRHEFSYLVRATTSGTFNVAGTWAEEMYAPEVNGRSAPEKIVIK